MLRAAKRHMGYRLDFGLETVPEGQLPADARTFCTVTSDGTAPGLNGECVMPGHDTPTGLDEVGAVIGRVLAHGVTVKRTGCSRSEIRRACARR